METQVNGKGLLSIEEITKAIKNSTSFGELLSKWRSFGKKLQLKDEVLEGLQRRLKLGTYEVDNLPQKLLKIWKANQGSKATLEILCNALCECNLPEIADALEAKFGKTSGNAEPLFSVQDELFTLKQLLRESASEQLYEEIKEKYKTSGTDKPIPLLRETVTPRKTPDYYISRTFISKTELDEQIFKDDLTKEHVFVVKGASKKLIRLVSGSQTIDISTNQLKEITVRFIILTNEGDFGKICKISTTPVHLIMHKKTRFFWIKSTHGMDTIKTFLKNKINRLQSYESDDSCDSGNNLGFYTFGEAEAVQRIISLQPSSAITIAESPGMGKTFVLTRLAEKIGESDPKAIIIFIGLSKLVSQTYLTSSCRAYLDHIFRFATEDHSKQSILKEMWRSSAHKFYLLLDGYDEVFPEKLDLIDSILQHLLNTENIKMIITTRKNLQPRLENLLNTISLEMLPFTESNQINFLTKYWTSQYGTKEVKSFKMFAKRCLNKLKMQFAEIDGLSIPFQCSVLAELYEENTILALNEQQRLVEDSGVKEISYSLLNKVLIEKQLSKIRDPMTRQKYLDAHIYESVKLLFPNLLENFKPFLTPRDQIDENALHSIGLLENGVESPSFVYQTMPEHFLANFVIKNLKKSYIFVDFFFKQILGELDVYRVDISYVWRKPESEKPTPTQYKLKHSLIANFLNMNLPECIRSKDYSELDHVNITKEDIWFAIYACFTNNLKKCFDFVWSFTIQELELNLSDLVYPGNYVFRNGLKVPKFTPFHLALSLRKYSIVKTWLKECGRDVRSIKHVLHVIVISESSSVIGANLSIIDDLVHHNKLWLEEELEGRKPLLQKSVSPEIIKHLVKMGANINENSPRFGTIIHTAYNQKSIRDLVLWTFKSGFNLVNHTNEKGKTPLMHFITGCSFGYDVEDEEILELFHHAGADFNAQDCEGNSVLFYAIKYSGNCHLMQKLLDYGANPNHKNFCGRNAVHILLDWNFGFRPDIAVKVLKLLKSNKFNGLNKIDNQGLSPLMLAVQHRRNYNHIWVDENDYILLQILDDKEFNFNAQDNDGNSVLFYAIKPYANLDFIEKLLDCGADPNHRNCSRKNVAHWTILKFNEFEGYKYLALEILKLLQMKGFEGFDQKDLTGDTPLRLAVDLNFGDREFLDFLREQTSRVNALPQTAIP